MVSSVTVAVLCVLNQVGRASSCTTLVKHCFTSGEAEVYAAVRGVELGNVVALSLWGWATLLPSCAHTKSGLLFCVRTQQQEKAFSCAKELAE